MNEEEIKKKARQLHYVTELLFEDKAIDLLNYIRSGLQPKKYHITRYFFDEMTKEIYGFYNIKRIAKYYKTWGKFPDEKA